MELAVTEFGDGPPVVVLHGLFGSARNWTAIARRLASSHRVYVPDLRNHGASPWSDAMSYADLADDVRALIERRGLGRASLIGHSMGGKAAMLMALRHGEVVDRLVVVDVAPVAYRPVLLDYARAMRGVDLAGITRRSEADGQLRDAIPNTAERQFLLQNLVFEEGRPEWRINLPVLERAIPGISGFPDLSPDSRHEGPVLFVGGGRSDYVRPEHEGAVRQRFPNARIARVPDAGHWVHAEQPDAFLNLVEPFLDGGRPGSG